MTDHTRPPATPPAVDPAAPGEPTAGASAPLPGAGAAGDVLAEWVGGAVLGDPESAVWQDAAFVDWLAAEARAVDRAARRRGDAACLARGDALLARAQARQLGVLRFPSPLPVHDAPAPERRAPRAVREGPPAHASAVVRRVVPVVELGVAAGPGRDLWDEPPERWVRVPDALPDARYLALRVVGTSMAPMLASGDVVLVRADARGREARAGRVVVARHPDDGYVCKRVASVSPGGLVLASLEPGHRPLRLPADPSLVVGTVVGAWAGR